MANADAAKHAAMLIALSPKPGESKGEPGDDAKGDDSMEKAALDDMFDALESKDKGAFGDALKRCIQLCMAKEDEDEEGPASKEY
jgi:hypothetical protein